MKAFAAPRKLPEAATGLATADPPPAIDLVHLARQTLGDAALELELLEMFDRQSARLIARLLETDRAEAVTRANLAHTLRGSALALGANRVAEAAAAFEACCAGGGQSCESLAQKLAEAVFEARAEIGCLAR